MAEPGTFEKVLGEIGQAFLPLRQAFSSPDEFVGLLQRLGWHADDIPQPLRDLGDGVETLYDSLRRLLGDGGLNVGGVVGDGGASAAGSFSPDDANRVVSAFQAVIKGIRAISTAPSSAFPATLVADGFLTQFPQQLVEYLVITYIQRFHPSVAFGLRSLGVIKAVYTAPAGNRPAYTHFALDLVDLPRSLGDPSAVLHNAFGWGDADFDFGALASQADNLLMTVGMDVRIESVLPSTALAIQGPADPETPQPKAVRAIIFERVNPGSQMTAALRLLQLPADGTSPPGLALLPSFDGTLGFRFELGPDIAVTIKSEVDLQGGVGLLARPGQPVGMVLGFESAGAPVHATGSIEVTAERSGTDGQPVLLLGSADGTRLQFRKIGGSGGVRLVNGAVDFFAEFDLNGLEFIFQPSDADGFIAKIVPAGGFGLGADLTLGISHREGFYFRGTSNLEIQLPTHIELGPLEIQGLTISALPSADGLPIGLGASFRASLGPIQAAVEQIGLSATFTAKPDHDGNLGPLDVSLGFKPPRGAGLSVDTGVVKGGGFLYFDPDHGEYAGALDLEFADFVELKAIGLITTRMPDGSPGFSLLIMITAEFGSGIQLGYGFVLLGVGGLIGLNRGMNLQALVEGVRTGSVESVMFPVDVIANAPRILSDLRRFFPPEEGQFLVGPMAKIGWGTPTLVSVSLGLIIEIPPGDIAILGVLKAALPTADQALLVLQVDFVGAFEPDKSRLWFFAQLFDSHILTMTIDGGMGLLVAWGDNPDFVLTVGGFHPSYKPPPLPFPVPQRLQVDILNQPGELIRVSGYFAVTSNTVQFGAKAEVRLGFNDFGIEGHLSFDALFRFSPFSFIINISAGVSLKAFGVGLFGIDLRFTLEGPAPWRAHGRGSISLLFFEISADFDITWGESRNTTLPPVAVLPLLAAEITKVEGWQTQLPTGSGKALVNLRQLPPANQLVLHPLGTLLVRQRALPLDVRLDRIGAQRPSDGTRFSVAPAPDSGLAVVSVTGDKFAMAQFQDMDDAAKLSRPAYETQDAGLQLTAAAGVLATARVVRRSARYELHIIDGGVAPTPSAARRRVPMAVRQTTTTLKFQNVSPAVFGQLLQGSSTSRSPVSQREATLRQPFALSDTVRVTDQRFVIAYVRNNVQALPPAALTGTPVTFRSQAAAEDAMAEWAAADPHLVGALHVIPAAEASAPLAVSGTWSPAGPLPAPVADLDAVRLPAGTVLATGTVTALFDPIAGSWSPAAPLATSRTRHTTSRLDDGRVAVIGGQASSVGQVLASVELYDPAAGTWSPGPNLATARSGHSATVLANGRVLVAGGAGARDSALVAAELFNPTTGQWSATGDMVDARVGHQAVQLADGQVLVVGGALRTGGATRALAYCELYDPATGSWTPTGSLGTARKGHQATLLPDGRVLVTGGDALAALPFRPGTLATTELYDPTTGAWTPGPTMRGGRGRHRALLLHSGRVLVVGGTSGTAGYRNATVYDPATASWTDTGPLATGRADFAMLELADSRVLVAGGTERSDADIKLTATTEMLVP
jgi:hypothetical protein